jgi:hypothetical protein
MTLVPREIIPLSNYKGCRPNRTLRGGKIMKSKVLIAGGLVLAFVMGTLASGLYTSTTSAFNPLPGTTLAPTNTVAPVNSFRSAPAVRTRYVAPETVSTTRTVSQTHKRSIKKSALIVGGSAGAGAAIGAVAGGGKGAAIGAMSGGVAGLIYDLATRNNN